MKKILVIDDEPGLREMVNAVLTRRGYVVIEAPDGREGVELARQQHPDLILCDINMQHMNGYLTLAALRDDPATAAIPFILMTGYADPAGMRHGMELGADDYLPKPFTPEQLHAAVEARLRKAQQIREAAERKLADLRDSISLALPHELRTPLNGILAYAELLATDAASLQPEEVAEMGQVILESGRRLVRLVENFLIYAQLELLGTDPARIQALREKRTPHARDVVEARAREVAAQAGRGSDLQLQLESVTVPMAEEYLARLVEELTGNAVKFSTGGTPVVVQLGRDSQGIFLRVRDRGCGMSPEQISRIGAYVQFNRKVREQQGLGLGLTICRRLAEVHGGGLLLESRPGEGTEVTVRWPGSETTDNGN
ncbi:hybrid sensor histidine kinase/response regulator [Limisphaera ngatamarikiensis]|uniref:histidine kinase n=1 Tax=Limisphaera ngatamarikiensis TaxID=1324935 RepID=A0A6M1RXE3_9BACT|nr:response regulator [Limisphaera ngatamarikiensis]NGO39994.1 hybrid sensor histidine kinase/response regulator [Limisphaera ngatamarikiensis]